MAEFSAVLVGQRLGFAADQLDNHAAYLGSWLRVLRGDRRFLLKAGAEAQRVTDFLLTAAAANAAAGTGDTTPAPGVQPAVPVRAPAAA